MKRTRSIGWLALGVLSLVLTLLLRVPSPVSAQTPPLSSLTELRGVWLTNIDSQVLFSRRNLNRGIRRLSRLNFNSLYPTVWNWGYTLYPSETARQVIGRSLDPEPGLQGRDMLREAVTRGHQMGMGVIPWFEFGFMAPADSALASRHPDWITSRRDGSQVLMEGIHPRVWLNPFHPEVQQFILSLIREIATNYDVDGIQFDDHFGLPAELGYDPYTVRLYQQENQGQLPPVNPQDPAWMRWRANKISAFYRQVFRTIKAANSDCIVSLSPNPKDWAYQSHLQAWQTWEREGYVEELIVQVYSNDLARFAAELDRPELQLAKAHIPTGIGVLVGLKDRPVDMNQITSQVQMVRDRRFAGVSFFFYETLGDRDSAFQRLFPTEATRPVLTADGRF